MFREIITKLAEVTRFDSIVNLAKVAIGAVEDQGEEKLALKLPSDEVVVLHEQGERSITATCKIPFDHFQRLPAEIKAHELAWFFKQGREVMLRMARAPEQAYPELRGIVSPHYSKFDNSDVLEAIGGQLDGMEVVSKHIGRDDLRLQVVLPYSTFDVSKANVGDTVSSSVTLCNNELGFGSASIFLSCFRLWCRNGATSVENFSRRIVHRGAKAHVFVQKLRAAIEEAGLAGEAMARLMRRSHDLALTAVDPNGDKLSRAVLRALTSDNIATKPLLEQINADLRQAPELFTAIQTVSDAKRLEQLPLHARQAHERAAGRLLQLATV